MLGELSRDLRRAHACSRASNVPGHRCLSLNDLCPIIRDSIEELGIFFWNVVIV